MVAVDRIHRIAKRVNTRLQGLPAPVRPRLRKLDGSQQCSLPDVGEGHAFFGIYGCRDAVPEPDFAEHAPVRSKYFRSSLLQLRDHCSVQCCRRRAGGFRLVLSQRGQCSDQCQYGEHHRKTRRQRELLRRDYHRQWFSTNQFERHKYFIGSPGGPPTFIQRGVAQRNERVLRHKSLQQCSNRDQPQ